MVFPVIVLFITITTIPHCLLTTQFSVYCSSKVTFSHIKVLAFHFHMPELVSLCFCIGVFYIVAKFHSTFRVDGGTFSPLVCDSFG